MALGPARCGVLTLTKKCFLRVPFFLFCVLFVFSCWLLIMYSCSRLCFSHDWPLLDSMSSFYHSNSLSTWIY